MVVKKHPGIMAVVLGVIFPLFLLALGSIMHVDGVMDVSDRLKSVRRENGTMVYELTLKDLEGIGAYDLMFETRWNNVSVKAGDEVIYEYGTGIDEMERPYVSTYIRVPVPETSLGSKLMIYISSADIRSEQTLGKAELCPREESARYYLTNSSLTFPAAMIFFVLAFCVPVFLLIGSNPWVIKSGFMLGGALLCISFFLLDSGGHFLVFTSDLSTWNILYCFSIYLFPAFILLYFRELEVSRRKKEAALIIAAVNFLFFLVAAVLGLTKTVSFIKLSRIYHVTLIADILLGLNEIYVNIKKPRISKGHIILLLVAVGGASLIVLGSFIGSILTKRLYVSRFDLPSIISILLFYLLCYLQVELIRDTNEKERQRKQTIKDLEDKLLISRLKTFTYQMQPHFLYNTLSSIQAIIYYDQDYASRLIGDFTVHLRGMIRAMSNDKAIPFSEELKNIKAYVNIEQMRLAERLTVIYDIQATDFTVIPLSIQPLVENAIKHGVYERGEAGGTVSIRSIETEEYYLVQVYDDGVGFEVEKIKQDIKDGSKESAGLQNLVFRLDRLMGARVEIESTPGAGTDIKVFFPKQKEVNKWEQ